MRYVLICGSRLWRDPSAIEARLRAHVDEADEVRVLTGGARNGADPMGHAAATALGLRTKIMKADWNQFGKAAGFIRNRAMMDLLADRRHAGHEVVVEAFTVGSPGTAHTIGLARHYGIECNVHGTE